MEKMTGVKAIKTFFERDDRFAPGGGRKVEMWEMAPGKDGRNGLTSAERNELASLCAAELGVEIG